MRVPLSFGASVYIPLSKRHMEYPLTEMLSGPARIVALIIRRLKWENGGHSLWVSFRVY